MYFGPDLEKAARAYLIGLYIAAFVAGGVVVVGSYFLFRGLQTL